jgi:hypothetical protein
MSTLNATNLKNPNSTSNNIVLAADGSTAITTLSSTTLTSTDITGTTIQGTIKSGTSVASTSGTSIDFTSIPSWVKRVTVMFDGVSTNGSSIPQVQLGDSGGPKTSGYLGTATDTEGGGSGSANHSAGFLLNNASLATYVRHGAVTISYVGSNVWVVSGTIGLSNLGRSSNIGGSVTLSGTLDRVRITTVNGTDTFDAGSINILYEG